MPAKKTPGPAQAVKEPKQDSSDPKAKTAVTTRVKIHYNCGFNNNLYIRGQGANLNWDKGHLLKNIKADEWLWESTASFNHLEFKILINDKDYEKGENHKIRAGETQEYTPHF